MLFSQVAGLYLASMIGFSIIFVEIQGRIIFRSSDGIAVAQEPSGDPLANKATRTTIDKNILAENEVEIIKPYEFGFHMNDGNGTTQHRQEVRLENGDIRGSYGYLDSNGVYREVEYYTDAGGYHANVKSNEPGLSNKNSANVEFVVENPPKAALISQQQPLVLIPHPLV